MTTPAKDSEAYNTLAYYTLMHRDPAFIHQLLVDTYAAQHADSTSRPIYAAFALAGLYLHNEKGFIGKQVQLAHMQLAKHKESIPLFELPADRGGMQISDVLEAEPGSLRDAAIEMWSRTTWGALKESTQERLEGWLKTELNP